ncbi:hypothetical protein [Micromonospora sp. NPDC023633]|uniref:hypothetical protein n=1 Tax=Micromonospora sp. NPDC023633 TaxID=3154320 RepID=UPI0033C96FC0
MGRAKVPQPADPTHVRLAQLTAQVAHLTGRHDQAIALVDERLRTAGGNRQMVDALLDLRNLLRPPERPA